MTDMTSGHHGRVDPSGIVTQQDFGAALTRLREAASLTIRAVCTTTQIPTSTLGGYFNGRHVPAPDQADRITKIVAVCGVIDPDEVEQWQAALRRVRQSPGKKPASGQNPYRGLERFQPEDAKWFFGREALTADLVGRLSERQTRGGMLVVVGQSGSGKSSLLRAGLIAELRSGCVAVGGSAEWPVLLLNPGQYPLQELASRLAALTETEPEVVYGALRADPRCSTDLARRVCLETEQSKYGPGDEPQRRLVLIVDQFEEVFAPGVTKADRAAFIAALDALANRPSEATGRPEALVVLGLRADFYEPAARHPALRTALQDGQLIVGSMTEQDLRAAITEPARRGGGYLEDGLVELLMRDLPPAADHDLRGADQDHRPAHGVGALPLLSHALRTMWELRRPNGCMTVADYREIGDIRGALAQTAEDLYQGLPEAHQGLARLLFLRLVHIAADTPDTLRRVKRGELVDGDGTRSDQLAVVLDQFVEQRLITVGSDRVEITHNALLTAWPRLGDWIDADRIGLTTRLQLTEAARGWRDAGRDPEALYRGLRLVAAREWAADSAHQDGLNALEREYLDASIKQHEDEEQAERRRVIRLRRILAIVAVLAVLASGLAVYAFEQQGIAEKQRILAVSRQVAAEANLLRGSDPALAAQLALIAYRMAPTVEARSSLLDTYSGPTATRALGPTGFPQTVAFNRDSSLMATAGADSADTAVRVWSLADRHHPRLLSGPLDGHTGPIYGLAFSPDGRTLVSSGADRTIRVWDLSNPAAPRSLGVPVTGPAGTVFAVVFSPDGRTLAVGSGDDTVRLYNITTPSQPGPLDPPLTGPMGDVQSLAFSPTGTVLAAGSADGTVRFWNVVDPAAPTRLDKPLTDLGSVLHVTFSPDGQTLATGGAQKTVRLWNVTDPGAPRPVGEPLAGPAGLVNFVAFSGDGRTMAAASSDNKVWVWSIATRETIATLPHPGPATVVRFLDDDGTALASSAVDGVTRIWTLPGPVITDPTDIVFTAAISSDGRSLLVGHNGSTGSESADQKVRLWDITNSRRPVPLSPALSAPTGKGLSGAAALSPDHRTVAAGTLDGPVYLWDVSDPAHPVPLDVPLTGATQIIESVTFSPDGKTLAAAGDDTTVRIWDVTDPRRPTLLATLDEPGGAVYATAFSADGRLLAAASGDKRVWLWDISNRKQPFRLTEALTGPTKEVYSVAFSGDNRTLAAGSVDKTVRLWDISDPRQPTPLSERPLTGPNNTVYWLTFSPNTRLLAAGGGDGTVWMWDLTDRRRPVTHATLTALPGAVWYVSFSPEGHTLAAGSSDTTARLWETDPEAVARYICAVSGDTITSVEWNQHLPALDYDPPCRP